MDATSIDLTRSADLIVRRLLAVAPGEQVAIVCDPHSCYCKHLDLLR